MADNNDQIYNVLINHLSQIREDIGRLETKVDYSVKLGERTNGRVTKLEMSESIRHGKNVVFGSIGGFVGGILLTIINSYIRK